MDLYGTKYVLTRFNQMSKLTMESLEKSCKDNTTTLYSMYIEAMLCKGNVDNDLQDRIEEELPEYIGKVTECVIDIGGDPDVVMRWFKEGLNEIKIGDIVFDYIERQEES